MNNVYLPHSSPAVLLEAGRWRREDGLRSAFFHERLCMEIPETLLARIYAGLLSILEGAAAEASTCHGPSACMHNA